MRRGLLSAGNAATVHGQLARTDVELYPYSIVAERAWELRENVTPYDAGYVALAELLDCPLATLDRRLVRSPGPTCPMRLGPPT